MAKNTSRSRRLFTTLILATMICLPLGAHASGKGNVAHRTLAMSIGEPDRFLSLSNISTGEEGLFLASEATEGLAASAAIQAPVTAQNLGVIWSAKSHGGALGLALRTSSDGLAWSPWIDVKADEHMTDHVTNTFYSRLIWVPEGASYVQYSVGMSRTEASSKSPTLNKLDISFIDAGESGGDAPEMAVTDQPDMLSRTEWGCPDGETSSNNPNPSYTDVSHLIVHHTATTNDATDWAAQVRSFWSYHVNDRGWADIGYNFLVDPNGVIYVGRAGGDNVLGAHFSCQNGGTQGIALIGDFTSIAPTDEALNSLEELLAWLASREGLDPAAVTWHTGTQLDLAVIAGHRDGNNSATGCTVTACPGDTFYPMLPEVRVKVGALIEAAQLPDPVIEDLQTELVARFTSNSAEAEDCWGVFEVNGHVLGNLHTAGNGCRLYRFEESGDRVMLADINTAPSKEKYGNPQTAPAWPGPPFNGWSYFEGSSSANGFWRTDGISVEPVLADEDWPQGGMVTGRGQMDGRLYFTVESAGGTPYFFSTDGQEYSAEPVLVTNDDQNAVLVGSFFKSLLFTGSDAANGAEPRLFDGSEYSLLADIVPGAEDSNPDHFFMLDDHWLFVATLPEGGEAFFRTDGETVVKLDETGSWADRLDESDPSVKSSGAIFMAQALGPGIPDPPVEGPIGVMRLTGESVVGYELGDLQSQAPFPRLASLGNDALALAENHFFRLDESTAVELPYNFPTDQDGVELAFIGSNPYFPFAFVRETEYNVASRVWAWTENEIGRLLAGENNEISDADHFTHIGEDIWFYGEDAVNGRALRRIPGIAKPSTPWMGAITGAWYDPATDGQGFVLHAINDTRSVISFYGYEADGTQLWLLGTGEAPFEAGVESEITMHIYSGGTFGNFTPEQVATDPWGTLRINFQTCRQATAELDGLTGQQAMQMVRLTGVAGLECKAPTPPLPHTAGVTGTWFEPATSGQGFVLHAVDDSRILVSFYGYRNDSARLWLLGVYEGLPAFGEPLTMEMALAEGGDFGSFEPGDIDRSAWGTLVIEFHDCGTATAILDGVDGQQTLDLVKLAQLDGSERACSDTELD